MLKVKNGKLYGSNFAFAMPDGYDFDISEMSRRSGNKLEFWAYNRSVLITIIIHKFSVPAKQYFQKFIEYGFCVYPIGDFISVKRGQGEGIGLFYRDNGIEYYEERYNFNKNKDDETQLEIEIKAADNNFEIQTVLLLPTVKAFLESIEYF